jgi:isoleucyl-tRNA synthetase
VTRLLAPITPFVTERVWQDMVVPVTPDAASSVHLATYPVADDSLISPSLSADMALVRRLVELGRTARAESAVKTRQPLSRALVSAPGFAALDPDLIGQILDELNVQGVESLAEAGGSLVDTTAKANFRTLGKRFGKGVQAVAAAIAAADAAALSASLRSSGAASVVVDESVVSLGPDEVVITETPRSGWAVASGGGATVALDLEITPSLRQAGVARDVIRLVQEARKSSGLDVSDRIVLRYAASDETASAVSAHAALIAEEVLATDFAAGTGTGEPFADEALALRFWIAKA